MSGLLPAAVEAAYRAFRQPRPSRIEGCPCCVGANADRALLGDRRHVPPETIEHYAWKAMTTWGDVDAFRHFLPRILELTAAHRGIDLEVLLGKLDYGHWETWPDGERAAVRGYFEALWRDTLLGATGHDPEEVLEAALKVGADADALVARLLAEPGAAAARTVARLVRDWAFPLVNESSAAPPAARRLVEPAVRERLERAFFEPGADEPLLSEAIELLTVLAR